MINSRGTVSIDLNTVCKVVLMLFICCLYAFYDIKIFVEVIYLTIFGLYYVMSKSKITIYTVWNFLFIGICLISNLWTYSMSYSIIGVRAVLEVAVIGNLMISFLDKKEKIYFLTNCFVIAGVVLVSKLLIVVPLESWGTDRIGDEEYNSNTLGIYLAISAICALQAAKFKRNKILYYSLILGFFLVGVLTGSRKAFVLIMAGSAFLYWLNTKKISRKLLITPISLLTMAVGYQLVMSIPELYTVMGSRLESLANMFVGDGYVDNSALIRMALIEKGLDLFQVNPYLGYGVATYTEVSGTGVYAHNNFIELLVGVGIIGTCIYYSIYIYSIFKLYKLKDGDIGNIFLIIICMLAIMEFGLVSYFNEVYQIIIASAIAVIRLLKCNNAYQN